MHRTLLPSLALVVAATAASAQTPQAPRFVPVPDNAVLGTNLNGLAVYDGANDKVGTIADEVIASGRLGGYVLSIGGFLGMGERYVVVAPAGLVVSYDAAKKAWSAKIDATKDQLKAAPEFKYEGRWGR